MIMIALLCLFTSMALAWGSGGDWTAPCPFNEKCICVHIHEQPADVFFHIECGSDFMPSFNASNGSLGASVINITGDLSTIPAGAFAPFRFVYFLYLTHQPQPGSPGRTEQNWDAEAFLGSEIDEMQVTNVGGLLPPPPALNAIRNMTSLRINAGGPSELGPNSFSQFRKLAYLCIDGTPISKIHDDAFAGLTTIRRLQFTSGTLFKYPRNAFKALSYVDDLVDITDNNLTGFQPGDFALFPKLGALYLNGNDLRNAVESGSLDELPPKLAILQLANGSLQAVPTEILRRSPYIDYLDLSGNQITSLKRGHFQADFQFMELNLHANPITTMEKGVFTSLPHLRVLTLHNTQLSTIDLSELDVAIMEEVTFYDNPYLKSVTISGRAPYFLKRLSLHNTSVETLDPKLDSVMVASFFQNMDFTNNRKFICDASLGWMPKHVFCPYFPIEVTGTTCGNLNGKSLQDYLRETFPDPAESITWCRPWPHARAGTLHQGKRID